MDWTTNLIVQIVAGFVGAHLAAAALHEQRFGWLGHSLVGAIAGAISGYFLQSAVLTVVTGSGSLNELRTGKRPSSRFWPGHPLAPSRQPPSAF